MRDAFFIPNGQEMYTIDQCIMNIYQCTRNPSTYKSFRVDSSKPMHLVLDFEKSIGPLVKHFDNER